MNHSKDSSVTLSTQSIKIYERTYQLPVINSLGFAELQKQIKNRQQIIKSENRPQSQFFGLFKTKNKLTFDERFQELKILIKDYNNIISFLSQHKEAYQIFFVQLTEELKGIVNQKCQKLAQVEQKRLQGLQEADNDPVLVELYQNQQQQIFRSAFVLHRAAQLMLKKVKLINKSLQKLASDQVDQQQLLGGMVGKLEKYQKAYALQREIDKIEQDINKLADVAINFESIMRDFFGPFQGLIDQVVSIDQELSGTVEEIRVLAGDILSQDARLFAFDDSENLTDSVIEFLIKSNQKQEHIGEAFENIRFETLNSLEQLFLPLEVLETTSLTTALNSIQNDVNSQLNQLSANYKIEAKPLKKITIGTTNYSASKRDDLSSDRNVDYSKLRNLLKAGKWQEADNETYKVMLQVAIRSKDGWLSVEDIDNFPCTDLRIINQFWLDYSGGRFGFTVQKEIYQGLGGTKEYNREVWKAFGDQVRWRKRGSWLSYKDITFNTSAPLGHLPFCVGCLGRSSWVSELQGLGCGGLFSRVKTCKL